MKKIIKITTPDNLGVRWRIFGLTIVVICLFFTYYFWSLMQDSNEKTALARFDLAVDSAVDIIEKRFTFYSDTLYGGRALHVVDKNISNVSWNTFIKAQNFIDRYPGINSIVYGTVATRQQADEIVATLNADRASSNETPIIIRPEPLTERLVVVTHVAPMSSDQIIGFNALSNKDLSAMIASATDTALPRASVSYNSLIKGNESMKVVVIALATYEDGIGSGASIDQLRENVRGYVAVTLQPTAVIEDALESIPNPQDIEITVTSANGDIIYATPHNTSGRFIKKTQIIDVAGQPWTFVFRGSDEFGLSRRESLAPGLMVFGGLVFMLLVSAVYFYRTGIRVHRQRKSS